MSIINDDFYQTEKGKTIMIKCPFCKEEIQDDAIKCKHCGEVLNKNAYVDTTAPPTKPAAEVNIPIGKIMQWMRRTVVVPLSFLVVLCIAFNAQRVYYHNLKGACFSSCHSFVLGPLKFHLHNYSDESGWSEGGFFDKGHTPLLLHSPVFGLSLARTEADRESWLPMVVLPIVGMVMFIGFTIFWWRLLRRQPAKAQTILKVLPEVFSERILTLRFDLKHLGLGEKIILGSAIAAILSLFLPWISMGIISSSGWNQQGYVFFLLFVYPVIGVFNVKRLNKIAGIICGALALVITIGYIADKHYEIMGVTGNASGSGLYLFAASTIGLIVGAVKYKRPANL